MTSRRLLEIHSAAIFVQVEMRFKFFLILVLMIGLLPYAPKCQEMGSLEYVKQSPHEDIRIEYQVDRKTQIKHGQYTYYYRNTKLVSGKYHKGRKNGTWKRYYLNGVVAIEAYYIRGVKHGKWKYYHRNKNQMAIVTFEQGKRLGEWKSWFPNQDKRAELNFKNDSLIGKQTVYYSSESVATGTKKNQEMFVIDLSYPKGGKKEVGEKYFPNGRLEKKYTTVNNHYVGIYQDFYFTGLPWRKFKYDNDGRLNSIFDMNNPIHKDSYRGTFRDGDGELMYYGSDGGLVSRQSFHQGYLDGRYVQFEDGGDKELITGFYNDNKPVGVWKYFKPGNSRIEVMAEVNYIGQDTAYSTIYGSNFKQRYEGLMVNEKRENIWRAYSATNYLTENTNYKYGFKNGLSTKYREFKRPSERGYYLFGAKVGTWQYFNGQERVVLTERFQSQVYVDNNYIKSDSCKYRNNVETAFYNTSAILLKDEKRARYVGIDELHMNFGLTFFNGNYSSWNVPRFIDPTVDNSINDYIRPRFASLIPSDATLIGLTKDYNMGLLIETLNPRRIKDRKNKQSPKLGVAMVVIYLDEFGCVEKAKIVRGVGEEWDKKIETLFKHYQFWEPALIGGVPLANALQVKIPVELEDVKNLK